MAGSVLPKSSRAAWVNAETGFYSAMTRSGPGSRVVSMKVFARNTSGKMAMLLTLLKTSDVRMTAPVPTTTRQDRSNAELLRHLDRADRGDAAGDEPGRTR
jgi:hypothetical protein